MGKEARCCDNILFPCSKVAGVESHAFCSINIISGFIQQIISKVSKFQDILLTFCFLLFLLCYFCSTDMEATEEDMEDTTAEADIIKAII